MQHARTSVQDAAVVERIFNTPAATVATLYLTTHSVTVTIIGAVASTVITCWSFWLDRQVEGNCSKFRPARSSRD